MSKQIKDYPLNFISISRNAEGAIGMLIELAQFKDNDFHPVRWIAKKRGYSARYLKIIGSALEDAGLIEKAPDQSRVEYRLKKPANEIMLMEVLSIMDGAFTPMDTLYCYMCDPAKVGRNKKLKAFFGEIMEMVLNKIEKTSIEDISL